MSADDISTLVHPAIAVFFVFPLIGMVVHYAWQTRQRRLQTATDGKSKIAPAVGPEHLKLGRYLSASVVGIALLGLAQPIFSEMAKNQTWAKDQFRVTFVLLMFALTIASLILLYKATTKLWRGVFATLTGMGLILLGCQPEIYRRGSEWYVSHYYCGISAAMLMIFSLAIVQDIYKDRSNGWRKAHVVLNCVALFFFIGQAFTGTRDLLEIPLSWQKPYVEQLYIQNCQSAQCEVKPAPQAPPP